MKKLADIIDSTAVAPALAEIGALHNTMMEIFYTKGVLASFPISKRLSQLEDELINTLPKINAIRIYKYTLFDFVKYRVESLHKSDALLLVAYKPTGVPVSFWTCPLNEVEIE